MIFAAGLGTRLKPFTENVPKALIEVGGKPMIERVISNLKNAGVTDIIINLHHFPEKIKAFLTSKNNFNLNITFSDETGELLETGGGLMRAAWFFDDGQPFLVHNVDILTNLNLTEMMEYHCKWNPIATLFVQQRMSSRYLLFDDENQLKGWVNKKTGERIDVFKNQLPVKELAFNGIHIINPDIFKEIKNSGKFSIIPAYLEIVKQKTILSYQRDDAMYLDIGKPESLAKADTLIYRD